MAQGLADSATAAPGISPSAHTAPSSKYSFFQMGTVRLSVSMPNRQASNAARAMGRAHADEHAGLADIQPSQAMHQRNAIHGKLRAHRGRQFPQLGQRPCSRRLRIPDTTSCARRSDCARFLQTPPPRHLRALSIPPPVPQRESAREPARQAPSAAPFRAASLPPLTGGRKATSSPAESGERQSAKA